ncbi:hypothetical protein [Acetobacter sicerae]|uniref:hypothetical protein n=1 Tax=Acetobacter sicerae TaxID=85325 RepID=UPI00156B0C09|nr:hypothetical protein [Acetobacter sicerae]NHN93524.1 hypothetical protein [Acetobacter sicerae]
MNAPHPDDIVVWPDDFHARVGEVRSGQFSHRSDDFEIVACEDVQRLRALGVDDGEAGHE